MNKAPTALENMQDGLTDALNMTTNNVNVVNNNPPPTTPPEVQVVASVPQAGVSSKSHSFQRLNDQTFGPSYG